MDCIKIYKKDSDQKKYEIIIPIGQDDIHGVNIFEPHDYEENPYISIELENLFFNKIIYSNDPNYADFVAFYKDFGTNENWYIEFYDKEHHIDLREFKDSDFQKNNLINIHSYYFSGTKIKLKIYPKY